MKTQLESQLRCAGPLIGNTVESKSGEPCGKCCDFLFDDKDWTVRYLVVDTGGIFSHHKVLLSPYSFNSPEFGAYSPHLRTVLDERTIEDSPRLETDEPISRKYERRLAEHYGYPPYWAGAGLWGITPSPIAEAYTPAEPDEVYEESHKEDIGSCRIRSFEEVDGYDVVADGEDIGKLKDLVVETLPWRIRYFVVKTGNWLTGRLVLFSPEWIDKISWNRQRIEMYELARAKIENAPTFDPESGINRDDEGELYDYYGRRRYW